MSDRVAKSVATAVTAVLLGACSAPPSDRAVPLEGIQPCDAALTSAVEATIDTQITAFGREDFPAAYEMAAPDFRAAISLVEFEEVIRDGFVPLMNVESFTVSQCVWDRKLDQVEIGMTLTTTTGVVGSLLYSLVLVPEGWRIMGAVPNPQEQQGT